MWKNKEIKKEAKEVLKRNYWKIITACLIIALLTGTTNVFFNEIYIDLDTTIIKKIPNAYILKETINLFAKVEDSINNIITDTTIRGVFYNAFNNITKYSSFLFGILNSTNQIISNNNVSEGIVMLSTLIIVFLYVFFIGNALKVGEARFLLESKNYSNTQVTRILFVFRIKRIKNVVKIMFFRSLYLFLWSLTIIGGIIKFYSYRMIPYILAENPDINKKEAFLLSLKMMRGSKFRTFLLDLYFLFWQIASFLTFGILGILFVNPYKKITFTQLYMKLRDEAIKNKITFYQKLNDIYLYDVSTQKYDIPTSTYPVELFSIKEDVNRSWITINYNKNYSIQTIILLFFTYSGIGWIWEIFQHLSNYGTIVNKGVLIGPWLPIYGSGGILMLILFKKWRDKPILTFFLASLVATIIEYGTGWYLETFCGLKWWDYSSYLLNINGYISLENSIGFGMAGFITIYFAAPILDNLYRKIHIRKQTIICIILVSLFLADFAHSINSPNNGEGITIPSETRYLQSEEIIYNNFINEIKC